MAYDYLGLVNDVNRRLNEVELTSSNFGSAIGEYAMVKDAVNASIRYINQHEYGFPFNHDTETKTLTPGVVRYSIPTTAKHVDYSTARIKKDVNLGSFGNNLNFLDYKEYISKEYANQEDDIISTTLNGSHSSSVTTLTLTSTTGLSTTGTVHIGGEQVTYTGILGNDITGCTRGANSTTAATHDSGTVVTQFLKGEIPRFIVRTPDNNYLLYPYPNKQYVLEFDFFKLPTDLSSATDTPSLPVQFRYVIVDGAMYIAYMFRGETQESVIMKNAFDDGIKHMRTLYINKYDYIRSNVVNTGTMNTKILPSRVF
tara:strand:- start:153 stop:1091 length:939 start_codon:yes stop_codon:yes gene_type:complete